MFDGALTKTAAPWGIWFHANMYRGDQITQTPYPLEGTDANVPALPININDLLVGHDPWIVYKGTIKCGLNYSILRH